MSTPLPAEAVVCDCTQCPICGRPWSAAHGRNIVLACHFCRHCHGMWRHVLPAYAAENADRVAREVELTREGYRAGYERVSVEFWRG